MHPCCSQRCFTTSILYVHVSLPPPMQCPLISHPLKAADASLLLSKLCFKCQKLRSITLFLLIVPHSLTAWCAASLGVRILRIKRIRLMDLSKHPINGMGNDIRGLHHLCSTRRRLTSVSESTPKPCRIGQRREHTRSFAQSAFEKSRCEIAAVFTIGAQLQPSQQDVSADQAACTPKIHCWGACKPAWPCFWS